MTKSFYRSSVVAIVVFAIDRRASFEAIAGWVEAVKLEAPSAWLVLVGNKKDVTRREVEPDEAARMAEQLGCNSYRECSAFSGENLDELFVLVAMNAKGSPAPQRSSPWAVFGSQQTAAPPDGGGDGTGGGKRCCA